MSPNEEPLINLDSSSKKKHNIPLEHLDFKYVEKCENVKELEKIYKVLASGAEGKYPELEKLVFEKIKKLEPTSRVLRQDLPILSKYSIPKSEQKALDEEMEDFVKSLPNIEKQLPSLSSSLSKDEPPVRKVQQPVVINVKSQNAEKNVKENNPKKTESKQQNAKTNKSVKPKDYREWEKIEKKLEKELEENDDSSASKKETDENKTKGVDNKNNTLNQPSKPKYEKLIEDLPKNVKIEENLDDNLKSVMADQEKCKGNEAFNAGSYKEALTYYSRSIQYMPNLPSYNNRAMTYLKLEMWDKVIEDCNKVLEIEQRNVKGLLRRATAYYKKKKFDRALIDIDDCLRLEPNNKKALDLKKEIEKSYNKEKEEVEEVKAKGGTRLNIEDTSGSEDEKEEKIDQKEKIEEISAKFSESLKKKNIKITEVESDDYDEEEEEKKNEQNLSHKIEKTETLETNSQNHSNKDLERDLKFNQEEVARVDDTKIETRKEFELDYSIMQFKDKANIYFSNGQYGDALNSFSQAIDGLEEIQSKSSDIQEKEFFAQNLIVLYNNRAKCYQSIGDHKKCINDCKTGLELFGKISSEMKQEELKNTKLKLVWKKAYSFEMLEKYVDAFLEYESIMKIDNKFQNVQSSYNRVRNILNETGQINKLRQINKSETKNELCDANKNQELSQKSEIDVKKMYDEFKEEGNKYFKQNDFSEACKFYSKCIELDSKNIVGYLNRSMCYIKLNQPEQAIKDTTFVLEIDENNVKALYRRSLAYKLKESYDLVIKDLKKLISVESNNQIAIKDLKFAQDLFDKQLKQKTQQIKESNRKIVEIKEIKNEEKENKKPEKVPSEVQMPKQDTPSIATQDIKITSKIKPFSNITNGYEFLQAWNSINPNDLDSYTNLISKVEPSKLANFIGSKLDDGMLQRLLTSIHKLTFEEEHFKSLKNEYKIVDYLKNMSKVQRFDIMKLFMTKSQKEQINQILTTFDNKSDADLIKKIFDI